MAFLIGVIIGIAFTPPRPFEAVLAILMAVCGVITLTTGTYSIL